MKIQYGFCPGLPEPIVDDWGRPLTIEPALLTRQIEVESADALPALSFQGGQVGYGLALKEATRTEFASHVLLGLVAPLEFGDAAIICRDAFDEKLILVDEEWFQVTLAGTTIIVRDGLEVWDHQLRSGQLVIERLADGRVGLFDG